MLGKRCMKNALSLLAKKFLVHLHHAMIAAAGTADHYLPLPADCHAA
jgi:hypothetical protein